MMSRQLILIVLCTILWVSARAQYTTLQGKITNIEEVEGIHILNKNSRYNSVTDSFGNFSIAAKVLDTLVFSSVHYVPHEVVVTPQIIESEIIVVTLQKLINELDEVFIGHALTGDIEKDVKNIKVKKQINFDSLGIPGFKGKPEEKIPTFIGQTIGPTHVNVEALYNYISGYYRKLRIQRKWEAQNTTVAHILFKYPETFFEASYNVPANRVYDFLLFCIETTSLQSYFNRKNYLQVLEVFEERSAVYLSRLEIKEE